MTERSVEVKVLRGKDGKYDVYISQDGSSGDKYEGLTCHEIGENVASLIDTLEESESGQSHWTEPYMLIFTDGYSITTEVYASKALACAALEKQYTERERNEEGDEWDEDSYLDDCEAILYDCGEDVFVWKIVSLKAAQKEVLQK